MSLPVEQPAAASIISLPVLGLIVVSCLGLSWLMVPKQGELLERLFKDKQYERVVSVLKTQMEDVSTVDLAHLRHISSEQFTSISHLLNLTPREQLQNIFSNRRAPVYDLYIHHIALAAVRYVNVMPPAEALATIEPGLDRVPDEFRIQLLKLLAGNANGSSHPEVAGRCLQLACESKASDWTLVQEMVQSFRWSGQGASAFRGLDEWLKSRHKDLTIAQQQEADELHFTLALETGMPGQAFDLCLRQMETNGEAPPLELMKRAYSTALQSGRSRDLVPWMERFVIAMPQSKLSLAALRQASEKDASQFADYRQWCHTLAQWSDWNASFDSAFSIHTRLAAMGSAESLKRCLALYVFLGRTEEYGDLLLAVRNTAEGKKYRRQLARVLAELGQDDESKAVYEECLTAEPNDKVLLYEYGCLYSDMGDEVTSRRVFEQLVQLHPQDADAIKKLAEACIRDADYPTALALYKRLPDASHDHDTRESYVMIAESLDDYEAEYAALRLTEKADKAPSVELYLNLAETATHLPDPNLSTRVLEEGHKRLPDSASIRIALASSYLETGRFDEGLAYLLDNSLRNNFEAIQLVLSLCEDLPDPRRALVFLGDGVEKRLPLTATNRLQLAVISFNAGESADSRRLFASVPETPETRLILAKSYFQTAQSTEALRVMNAHLKDGTAATPDDWVMLGDIYQQMGLRDEAVKAYDHSLAMLTADLPVPAPN